MAEDRPPAEAMLVHVFDQHEKLLPAAKQRVERIWCTRKKHTIGIALRTPYGWWVAWRPPDAKNRSPWTYSWADEVSGYTTATCHCRRERRIDQLIEKMR